MCAGLNPMPAAHRKRLSIILASLGLAVGIAASGAAAAKPKPHKKPPAAVKKPTPPALAPGTYSGTVQMSPVTVGTSTYQARLTGTWTITVDAKEHATGSETLQATVPFTSPDSQGCTYSPNSWTLRYNGKLGTDTTASGTPGAIAGANLVISVSGGWSGSPDQYTRTCGNLPPNPWPIDTQYGFGSSTGALSAGGTLQFPLSFLKAGGKPYSTQIGDVLNVTFPQTYTLGTRPKP